MNLRGRVKQMSNWQSINLLEGKPNPIDPKRSIWLTSISGNEPNYLLWNIEVVDEEKGLFDMWPYSGHDTESLIRELLEKYINTAFDE